jgi:hypothetical protein
VGAGVGVGGAQYVRVLYNNEERCILGEGAWCPLPVLYARLDGMSLSRAQYAAEAVQFEKEREEAVGMGGAGGAEVEAELRRVEREARVEIAATIDAAPQR